MLSNKYFIITALAVAVVFASGCIGQQSIDSTTGNIVIIKDFKFTPSALTVNVGTTVLWTNEDSVQHTVTSDTGNELGSQYISDGQSYSHIFNTVGTFDYHCTPHPFMKGTVIVQ